MQNYRQSQKKAIYNFRASLPTKKQIPSIVLSTITYGLLFVISIVGFRPQRKSISELREAVRSNLPAEVWVIEAQSMQGGSLSMNNNLSSRVAPSSSVLPSLINQRTPPKNYKPVLAQSVQRPLRVQPLRQNKVNLLKQKKAQSLKQKKLEEISRRFGENTDWSNLVVTFRNERDAQNNLIETNDLTLIGSTALFKKGIEAKNFLKNLVQNSNGILTFSTKGDIDLDHGVNRPLLKSFGIKESNANVIFLSKLEHQEQTKEMDYTLPSSISYVPGDGFGNALDYIDILKDRYISLIINRHNGPNSIYREELLLNNV